MKLKAAAPFVLCAALWMAGVEVRIALGQATAPATQPAGAGDLVTMDFPADGVELRVLADIVTKRLKIPIIYDDSINNKKVIVHVPKDVPENALLEEKQLIFLGSKLIN